MAKTSKTAVAETEERVPSVKYDAATLSALCMKVKAEGFVPASVLRDEFGAEKTTQGIAVLYRDLRMFREVRRPWGESGQEALGYEWADRRFSKPEQKKIPPGLGFVLDLVSTMAPKYGDFQSVTARCRYTTPILGSVPVKDSNGDPTNVFERDMAGNALILRYHQRAMMSQVLPLIGKQSSVARHVMFSAIRIHTNGNVTIKEHGIVEIGKPGGKGLRRSESIPDGTAFTVKAMVPTSELSIAEFLQALRIAGEHVGLSPGRSAGFGDFEVLGAE